VASPDAFLANMKARALKGGEHGPHFDRGVLDVIKQVETTGYFEPTEMRGIFQLIMDQKSIPGFKGSPLDQCLLVTQDEMAIAKQFLAGHTLTLEQALKYIEGMEFAQNIIREKRKKPAL